MCNEIINRHVDFLALFQSLQHFRHKFDVEGVRVIKVVLVAFGQVVLLLIQNLDGIILLIIVVGYVFDNSMYLVKAVHR